MVETDAIAFCKHMQKRIQVYSFLNACVNKGQLILKEFSRNTTPPLQKQLVFLQSELAQMWSHIPTLNLLSDEEVLICALFTLVWELWYGNNVFRVC